MLGILYRPFLDFFFYTLLPSSGDISELYLRPSGFQVKIAKFMQLKSIIFKLFVQKQKLKCK